MARRTGVNKKEFPLPWPLFTFKTDLSMTNNNIVRQILSANSNSDLNCLSFRCKVFYFSYKMKCRKQILILWFFFLLNLSNAVFFSSEINIQSFKTIKKPFSIRNCADPVIITNFMPIRFVFFGARSLVRPLHIRPRFVRGMNCARIAQNAYEIEDIIEPLFMNVCALAGNNLISISWILLFYARFTSITIPSEP